jgi:deoxyribodipyrimidine photo-lyase
MTPAILWFRQDLRLTDNPALLAAVASGRPLIPLHVLDETQPFAPGGASRWWLHHSLDALSRDLAARGAPLVLARGGAQAVLEKLIEETGAGAVYWNRLYEPAAIARDTAIKASLKGLGVEAHSFNGSLLHEPWEIETQAGGPFRVFTPYWRAARQSGRVHAPQGPAPEGLTGHFADVSSDVLSGWGLLPRSPDWATGFAAWTPGEAGAQAALDAFLDHAVAGYRDRRNAPGEPGTSRLSPHLHFGEIGPRQIWSAMALRDADGEGATTFQSELGWREFAHHVLFHFPAMPETNLRDGFDVFPWREDPAGLLAWQKGLTGYPLVDAGMRELWTTGWMHNRVRMIVASFLIKDLMIDWRRGAEWFWDTLVDADLAANAFSWQWVAGCGFDAAPYFRVFNPAGQGERFDEAGKYVRRWCPELARLPDKWIHRPWEAPEPVLAGAGVVLGKDYPKPVVDHAMARERALAAFKGLRE